MGAPENVDKLQWAATIMAVVARCRDCHRPWGYKQSMHVGCIKNLQYLDDGLHLEMNHDTHEQAIKRAAALVAAVEPAKDVITSLCLDA
ncbi:hypothetical protein Tco_1193158 [Tanacetum coccineum]